jgi:hypothetical protein
MAADARTHGTECPKLAQIDGICLIAPAFLKNAFLKNIYPLTAARR